MENYRPLKRCSNDGCKNRSYEKYCFDCKVNQSTPDKERYKRYDTKERDPESYNFYHSKAWKTLRNAQIKRFPACQSIRPDTGTPCLSTDRLAVDHITPRKQGGRDHHTNLQTLCYSCHSTKTAFELKGHFGRTPIYVLCGPPGAGMHDYVQQRISPGSIVWDMDSIVSALTSSQQHYQSDAVISVALSIRTHLQSTITSHRGLSCIYWIESAPTIERRHSLRQSLNADVLVFETASDVCKQRISTAANVDQSYDWDKLIDQWWSKYKRSSLDTVISSFNESTRQAVHQEKQGMNVDLNGS